MTALTYDPLVDHPWKDIDGPIGLLLTCVFFSIVLLVVMGLAAFACLILLSEYVVSPIWGLCGRLHPSRLMGDW
jgi:hypothetical protein